MKINDSQEFTKTLMENILERGFGTLSKKDIDVLMMHLLFNDKQFDESSDHYEIAKKLKTTPAKVRNLIYDMQLRYGNEELDIKQILLTRLLSGQYVVDGPYIVLEIRNPQYKDLFEYEVRQLGGFSDGSFNSSVIKLKKEALRKLFNKFFDDFEIEKIMGSLSNEEKKILEDRNIDYANSSELLFSLLKTFADSTVSQVGKEIGKVLPDILTGGALSSIKIVKFLISKILSD